MSTASRILVVNDDLTQLHLTSRILEQAGYEVARHTSAAEALNDLESEPRVDLFLVDLHMPGIDGWKACRLLRSPDFAVYNETPILIVSATYTGADVEAITASLGANGFLPVPYAREQLLRFVEDLLAGRRPQQKSRVLIVEDDESVAQTLVRVFQSHGYEAAVAGTLSTAWQRRETENFDVVILDYHLPDGTCEEMVRRFHAPSEPGVTIVMTGDSDPSLPVRLMDQGADAYVRKPFDPEFLIELVRKAQRERSLLRVEAFLDRRTQELRASERQYRTLFSTIPDLVFLLSEDGRILEVNASAAAKLTHTASSLEGQAIVNLVPAEDESRIRAALAGTKESQETIFEVAFKTRGGEPVHAEITAVPAEHRGHPATLLVARDLSIRKKLEEDRRILEEHLRHAQRLESLGVLAGGIAHDFNNLLVGILGNASLALMDAPDTGTVRESLRQIEVAARRAAELTQQILTFSGRGAVVPRTLDLSSVVEEMGQLLEPAVSKKAAIAFRLDSHLPLVHADSGQIRQVVMNLIMNASDALQGQPGRIQVSTGTVFMNEVALSSCYLAEQAQPGRYVYVQVEDDGVGMDARTRQRMFDPFFTTKASGRGLGLAATLGIVRAHGGVLDLDSELGLGTRIKILLPALSENNNNRESEEEREPSGAEPEFFEDDGGSSAEGGSGVVMVVDDEAPVRRFARAALERLGYAVVEADNGRTALELLVTRHIDVDIMLLDVSMPELDGAEVLERLRSSSSDLPVLLSSGYGAESLPREVLASPFTAFIRKPYSPADLLAHIREMLQGAAA